MTTSIAPLFNQTDARYERLEVPDLVREMLNNNNSYCNTNFTTGRFLTGACMFRGPCSQGDIDFTLRALQDKNSGHFTEWIPDGLMSSNCQ